MRKFISVLAIGVLVFVAFPSCSTADNLDEVIEGSELDVTSSTDDDESVIAKPGEN